MGTNYYFMMGTDYYFRVMFSSMKKYIHRLSIRIPNKQFFLNMLDLIII